MTLWERQQEEIRAQKAREWEAYLGFLWGFAALLNPDERLDVTTAINGHVYATYVGPTPEGPMGLKIEGTNRIGPNAMVEVLRGYKVRAYRVGVFKANPAKAIAAARAAIKDMADTKRQTREYEAGVKTAKAQAEAALGVPLDTLTGYYGKPFREMYPRVDSAGRVTVRVQTNEIDLDLDQLVRLRALLAKFEAGL